MTFPAITSTLNFPILDTIGCSVAILTCGKPAAVLDNINALRCAGPHHLFSLDNASFQFL